MISHGVHFPVTERMFRVALVQLQRTYLDLHDFIAETLKAEKKKHSANANANAIAGVVALLSVH